MKPSCRLYLVRHAKTAHPWRTTLDSPLSASGHAQAATLAERIASLGPLPVVSSPLQRARQTAAPLATRWGGVARIDPRVSEIPAPGTDPQSRGQWLDFVLTARWHQLDLALQLWRDGVIEALSGLTEDTVVVSHYVVINAAVAEATGDDQVVCCHPANASTTVFDVRDGRLSLVGQDPAICG
jgi:broad specificity phosphatase PhoE